MRDALDNYLENKRRARKEFWLMVAVSAAALVMKNRIESAIESMKF